MSSSAPDSSPTATICSTTGVKIPRRCGPGRFRRARRYLSCLRSRRCSCYRRFAPNCSAPALTGTPLPALRAKLRAKRAIAALLRSCRQSESLTRASVPSDSARAVPTQAGRRTAPTMASQHGRPPGDHEIRKTEQDRRVISGNSAPKPWKTFGKGRNDENIHDNDGDRHRQSRRTSGSATPF